MATLIKKVFFCRSKRSSDVKNCQTFLVSDICLSKVFIIKVFKFRKLFSDLPKSIQSCNVTQKGLRQPHGSRSNLKSQRRSFRMINTNLVFSVVLRFSSVGGTQLSSHIFRRKMVDVVLIIKELVFKIVFIPYHSELKSSLKIWRLANSIPFSL